MMVALSSQIAMLPRTARGVAAAEVVEKIE